MSSGEIISIVAIPLTALLSFSLFIISTARIPKTRRKKISAAVAKANIGENFFLRLKTFWLNYFFTCFGRRFLAKRQLITIPLFSLLFSAFLFIIWFLYALFFLNPQHIIPTRLPVAIRVAVHDYYHFGLGYTLLLDAIVIQLSRFYILSIEKRGFTFKSSILYFISAIILVLLSLSAIILQLQREATDALYTGLGLYFEAREYPVFNPVDIIASSLNLIHNHTMIHFTSKGPYSTYFVPQSVMLYCSVFSQLALFFIILSCSSIKLLAGIKLFSLQALNKIGTPTLTAYGLLITTALIILLSIISIFAIIAIA
ncbi:hypothetical protein EDF73_10357 [Raoultella sp. BIGb0138]|uniref:hypothetical protein n=1 Tax=Raoultella sp. BIGb0138 TaxID=2485115 RepID=UPI0010513A54|nr:hypothetical protein [Raoultella sp. BIGb0138]TCW15035.1 hypothetical protein EDF73_10357 [Raoultella sp. BIGb0138]